MLVAVTGANGFVGRNILSCLARRSTLQLAPISRVPTGAGNWRPSPSLDGIADAADWARALVGIDMVVHCAGMAGTPVDRNVDPIAAARRVNCEGAVTVARGAAMAGVKRFVFLSSAKVLGEETFPGIPFRNTDPVAPVGAYAISKAEAEQALETLALELDFELVVLRPPLIYGPGVGGNVAALLSLIGRGFWLPFGDITRNRRSMISTDNLSDAIEAALTVPDAVGRKLLISDGDDISTREFAVRLAAAAGRRARIFRIPAPVLRAALTALGRKPIWTRLFGDLALDIDESCEVLGWRPHHSMAQSLGAAKASARADDMKRNSIFMAARRIVDVAVVVLASILALPLCLMLMMLIRLDSQGAALFRQTRVGRHQRPFRLVKLRTMARDTGDRPSHEVAAVHITRLGRFLRRTKLDELPQLWNILRGDMTFVGPRPCLPSQREVIDARQERDVFRFLPGVTGPAQIRGIDMAMPDTLAKVEADYFGSATAWDDVVILFRTVLGAGRGDAVDRGR